MRFYSKDGGMMGERSWQSKVWVWLLGLLLPQVWFFEILLVQRAAMQQRAVSPKGDLHARLSVPRTDSQVIRKTVPGRGEAEADPKGNGVSVCTCLQ